MAHKGIIKTIAEGGLDMPSGEIWQPVEDEVLREGVGLKLDDLCDAVNSLRRSLEMGNKWRSRAAVGNRCRKIGVRYKKG